MLTEASNYDDLYRDFRWDIPVRFNIASACCDRHADGTNRTALIYVDEDGGVARTSEQANQMIERGYAGLALGFDWSLFARGIAASFDGIKR